QVFSFGTEKAVNVAVFVGSQTHVINVGVRTVGFGQGDGVIPKAKVVDAVGTFGNSKKGFAINTFNAHRQNVTAVPVKRASIKCGVDALTLHQERVGLLVKIITPENRCVSSGQNRIFKTGVNPVAGFLGSIGASDQCFVFSKKRFYLVFKGTHEQNLWK